MGKQQQPRQRGFVGSLLSLVLLPLTISIAILRLVWHGLMSLDRKPPRTTPYNRPPSPLGAPPALPPSPPPPSHLCGFPRSFALIAAVVILIAGVLGGRALTQAFVGTTTTAAAATDTPLLTFPSGTATPVPTQPPSPINSPTLGGTEDAFTAAYGTQSNGAWHSTVAGQAVKIFVDTLQPALTADGQVHIYIVDVTVPDDALGRETWSLQTANAIAAAFFPSDAKHLSDGPGSPQGTTDHVSHSDELAATFFAEVFTNEAVSKTYPPGTFHFECHALPANAPSYGECYISVGTQY
jgi:hypothetical protein